MEGLLISAILGFVFLLFVYRIARLIFSSFCKNTLWERFEELKGILSTKLVEARNLESRAKTIAHIDQSRQDLIELSDEVLLLVVDLEVLERMHQNLHSKLASSVDSFKGRRETKQALDRIFKKLDGIQVRTDKLEYEIANKF